MRMVPASGLRPGTIYHMGYPERLLTEGEEVVTEFRPHWRLLVVPALWLIAALVAVIGVAQVGPGGTTGRVLMALAVAALIPLTIVPVVQSWFTRYILTSERLITRAGVIARSGIEIPVENINDIVFTQTVLERILKSGDLLIESAGESGQSLYSNIPKPEEFQSLLYHIREDRTRTLGGERSAVRSAPDPTEQLERLARLHREGVVTNEEFEAKKQALLDEL